MRVRVLGYAHQGLEIRLIAVDVILCPFRLTWTGKVHLVTPIPLNWFCCFHPEIDAHRICLERRGQLRVRLKLPENLFSARNHQLLLTPKPEGELRNSRSCQEGAELVAVALQNPGWTVSASSWAWETGLPDFLWQIGLGWVSRTPIQALQE